jgi:hypothetical protein
MNDITKEIKQNAKRYLILKNELISHKPHHYDGLPYGRFDLIEQSESNDLDAYLDNILKKHEFYTQAEYDYLDENDLLYPQMKKNWK